MSSRSLRSRYTPEQHRCCGALISIGAYGDWHLCEACEILLSPRHIRRAGGAPDFRDEAAQTADTGQEFAQVE